jgi:hypothetical protein
MLHGFEEKFVDWAVVTAGFIFIYARSFWKGRD